MIEIRIATEEEKDRWDEIVTSSPSGTLFHTWDWLKLMEKHAEKNILLKRYLPELIPILIYTKERIVGLFPVFLYKTPLLNMVTSPPFTVEDYYLGPILSDDRSTHFHNQLRTFECYDSVDIYLKKHLNAHYISIHSSPGMADSRPLSWRGYDVRPSFTYKIDLSIGKEGLFLNLSNNLQKNIKKAEKMGITIEESDFSGLRFLYSKLKDAGRIHAKEEFLIEIMERFSPKYIRVFIAKHGDSLLSGVVNICYKNEVAWWIGCPACSYNRINPNEVALWKSIEWAVDNGYDKYELMGADDRSLFFFKSKFNGALIPMYIAKWNSPRMNISKLLFQRNNF